MLQQKRQRPCKRQRPRRENREQLPAEYVQKKRQHEPQHEQQHVKQTQKPHMDIASRLLHIQHRAEPPRHAVNAVGGRPRRRHRTYRNYRRAAFRVKLLQKIIEQRQNLVRHDAREDLEQVLRPEDRVLEDPQKQRQQRQKRQHEKERRVSGIDGNLRAFERAQRARGRLRQAHGKGPPEKVFDRKGNI